MNRSTYRFTLDLQKHRSQMSIAVFQYDSAVRLCISLTDGGNPYLIKEGGRAVFYGMRPDDTPLIHNCMIYDAGVVIYDFNDQTAAVEGITHCNIRIYGTEGELISAPKFTIVAEERLVSDADVEKLDDSLLASLDEIQVVEKDRVTAESARVAAEEARVSAETARAEAELERAEAETERINNENARIKAEEERANAYAEGLGGKLDKIPNPEASSKVYVERSSNEGTTLVPVMKGNGDSPPDGNTVVQRMFNGCVVTADPKKPYQSVNLKTLEEHIAKIPGGGNGAKLYKHNINLYWEYFEEYDDYTDEYTIRLKGITLYTYDSAPITNIDEIISSGRCISAIGVAELNGELYVLCGLHREDDDFWAWVVAGEEYQSDWWIGSEYTLEINDVVEEV